jgi:predicted acylesterase/phospholipase RssA
MTNGNVTAPADRFCDLVMKGGITSGVVYPPAICALAREYFKSIGGTSAGAIAAAVTAAAEYQRRHLGKMDGFLALESLPADLGEKGAGARTQLLRLFQPDPLCRRLFGVLVGSLNRTGTFRRIGAFVFGCTSAYWFASLASVFASALVWHFHSWLAGVLFLLISLPLLVGLFVYRDLTRNVVRNNYGLCKGMTTDETAGDALTPWLHALIQRAAGRGPTARPLTFGDLWRAEGFPPESLELSASERERVRSIDLQMFTTNLTHGRPYVFPHSEPTARLFYRPDELAAYFPDDVMRWLNDHARRYQPSKDFPHSDPPAEAADRLGLKELPEPEDFPILLAARMSLSFPLLFAAVPLWAIDYEPPRAQRTFRRCMFSDGGISSNFPMHLFDGLVPLWPTFGIQLEAKLPERDNMIYLPQTYREGFADHWTRFDEEAHPASRLGGFLMSIVGAMQNWNDNTLARMPGVRDRVARVRLYDNEGGFNLNMPAALIKTVADRGKDAAEAIIQRFLSPPTPCKPAKGWDEQRWVRLDVFIRAFGQRLAGLSRALGAHVPWTTSYQDLLAGAQQSSPPGHEAKLTEEQMYALRRLTESLNDVAKIFAKHSPGYPNTPLPEPELRVRPPL